MGEIPYSLLDGFRLFRDVHRRDVGFPCVVHGIKSTALFLGQIADTKSAIIDQMAVAFVHTIFRKAVQNEYFVWTAFFFTDNPPDFSS